MGFLLEPGCSRNHASTFSTSLSEGNFPGGSSDEGQPIYCLEGVDAVEDLRTLEDVVAPCAPAIVVCE